MSQTFYLTTTLPYVNATPHIGFGMELVAADVLVRAQKALGKHVILNTGTDEHGQKIYEAAVAAGQTPQEYADTMAATFENLLNLLTIDASHFIRTTAPHHVAAAQAFWRRCEAAGDIYMDTYQTYYCVGCELEKQLGDLVDGRCPLHPNRELEERSESNYFFKFSRYQEQLLALYDSQPDFVRPESKQNEIRAFVAGGLKDFSISRLATKMPWGIPVPGNEEHVMYVWFDALLNYISTLGWPETSGEFEEYWPGMQIAGKDNLRQQSAMWQAMLLSAGLPPSQGILINGFISIQGQKMSKSLGNVIAPAELVDRYGVAATRYLLMQLGPIGQDIDVSWEQLDTLYTAHLANGLGNVCSRLAALSESCQLPQQAAPTTLSPAAAERLTQFDITGYIDLIDTTVHQLDERLSQEKPWKLTGQAKTTSLRQLLPDLLTLLFDLTPLMPDLATKLVTHFTAPKITKLTPVFARLEAAHG